MDGTEPEVRAAARRVVPRAARTELEVISIRSHCL